MASRSLAARSVAAVALMVGFYLLALGIIGGLLFLPYAELAYAHRLHLKLAFVCVAGAGAIAWAILPRRDPFPAPGPELRKQEHPALFELLEEVARKTGQAMPAEVYLVPELNAWVANRGGVMGFGSRRVMGLGLPLLEITTVPELQAVLAHEFGHYHGGDTRLGPWIYKTRSAIGRTLAQLGDGALLQLPFRWYGTLFLRITQAISRAQEFAADRLAATVVGAPALVAGLEKIHASAPAFDAYWHGEALPVLRGGFHPPLGDGFSRFLRVPRVEQAMQAALARELESGAGDPYDSHPPLRERIAAVADLSGAAGPPAAAGSARTLLGDPAACERALLAFLASDGEGARFEPVAWDDVTEKLFVPSWRRQAERVAPALGGATFAELPALAQGERAQALARAAVGQDVAIPDEHVARIVGGALGSVIAAALLDAGWSASAGLGENATLRRGDAALEPFAVVARLGEADGPAWWAAFVAQHGIGALPLAGARGA